MLFEQETLTPKGRLAVLSRLFSELGRKEGAAPAAGHVPVPVLEAHGDLETHLRYMIESAEKLCKDKERSRCLRKARHVLDALPEMIMQTLSAGPEENWLRLYRALVQLHNLLEDASCVTGADEYTAVVQKIVALAGAVASAGAVQVDGASMFTLMLMQVQLLRQSPRKRRSTRKPRRKKTARKKTPKSKAGG